MVLLPILALERQDKRLHARFVDIQRLEVEDMGVVAAKRYQEMRGHEDGYDKRRIEKGLW